MPDAEDIFLPILANSWHAAVFRLRWAKRGVRSNAGIFSYLREAASSAAEPASWADPLTHDSATRNMTDTSQDKDASLPWGEC